MNILLILLVGCVLFLVNNSGVDCLANTSSRRAFIDSTVLLVGFTAPQIAKGYERRDVGAEGSRSAATYAFNEQAYITNNRLEAAGLKIDTKEEDERKLQDAMKSFSYESSTGKKKSGNGKSKPK